MIRKQNKNKRKQVQNCRPISITNCIAKIFETDVKKVVLTHCENNGVPEMQSAHRGTRSTTDIMLILIQNVTEALFNGPKWWFCLFTI